MATFEAATDAYSLREFSGENYGLGWQLDSSRVALLVHDALPYYLKVLPEALRQELIGNIERLVLWAQRAGVPVLRSALRPAADLQQRGLGGRLWGMGPTVQEVSDVVVPQLREAPCMYKRSLSAFYATDLEVELRRLGRDQLLTAGVFTSGGVLATSFDALARDMEFFVAADASADFTADRHRGALNTVAGTTEQVVSRGLVMD